MQTHKSLLHYARAAFHNYGLLHRKQLVYPVNGPQEVQVQSSQRLCSILCKMQFQEAAISCQVLISVHIATFLLKRQSPIKKIHLRFQFLLHLGEFFFGHRPFTLSQFLHLLSRAIEVGLCWSRWNLQQRQVTSEHSFGWGLWLTCFSLNILAT